VDTRVDPIHQNAQDQKEKKKKMLLLKDKAKNFASLQSLQSEISWLYKVPKTLVDAKKINKIQKHDPEWECHK